MFLEQDLRQLLGRCEVEGLARQCMRLGFQRHDFLAEFVALLRQSGAVDQDAVALHLPEDLASRQFQFFIYALQPSLSS
ncbi:MAG: hypothetical protein BWY57_01228 [Betaproteobacteria bacterium ADurb.Bin341]|nr:MAG: hypothetical protein BWY57_01228 [Betaproteobacteria bacterium ADurb.Bin341]